MAAELNPPDPAGAREDSGAGLDRGAPRHVSVLGTVPGGNAPLRWIIVIVALLLVALGGTYLLSHLMASFQRVSNVRPAVDQQPTLPKQSVNPVPPGKAPGDRGGSEGESSLNVEAVLRLLPRADVNSGATVFKTCLPCHAAERNAPHKVGPNLWNMVGARKAALPDFRYSQSLRAEGGRWSYAELARYLHDTRNAIPGTSMAFFGIKDSQRLADVLAYMRTRADTPAPLPK
jgi:cytochrome c